MSSGARLTAIALGLVLASAVHAQQNEGAGGQGQADQQQAPTDNAPWALPVEIIEDEAEAQAREGREDRAEQREADDLTAQEGMNEATQKMADYAVYQTALIFIGTALLFYTLWLTRQANRAAVRAAGAAEGAVDVTREMGEAQARAYVVVDDVEIRIEEDCPIVSFYLHNCGNSPAFSVLPMVSVVISVHGRAGSVGDIDGATGVVIGTLRQNKEWGPQSIHVGTTIIPPDARDAMTRRRSEITARFVVKYKDVFDKEIEREYGFLVIARDPQPDETMPMGAVREIIALRGQLDRQQG